MLILPPTMQYPWHHKSWHDVWQLKKSNHLPHALLLMGPEGLGKNIFAKRLAQSILCQMPDSEGQPCNQCHQCHLMQAHSHPDFLAVSPAEAKQIISVEQIRDVITAVNETSAQNGWRIIIISPANAMNKYAANALLKTLEEPPAKTLLILVSDSQKKLPITILSRCQKIIFNAPSRTEALQWLISCRNLSQENSPVKRVKAKAIKEPSFGSSDISDEHLNLLLNYTEGAPLTAFDLIQQDVLTLRQTFFADLIKLCEKKISPLAMAKQWQDTDIITVTNFLLNWTVDMLRLKVTGDSGTIQNNDFRVEIEALDKRLSTTTLTTLLDFVTKCRQHAMLPHNLNKQLLLEDLFIHWTHYVSD